MWVISTLGRQMQEDQKFETRLCLKGKKEVLLLLLSYKSSFERISRVHRPHFRTAGLNYK
jgi:hypothetical protein